MPQRRLVCEVKIEGCLEQDARLSTHRSAARTGAQFSLFLLQNFSYLSSVHRLEPSVKPRWARMEHLPRDHRVSPSFPLEIPQTRLSL